MATTVQDNNRVAWGYVTADNTPVTYCVSAKAVYVLGAEAAKFGGSAAATSTKQIPKGFKMRKVLCQNGNKKRYVPCYTVSATLWTTAGTTVTLNENGVDATYTATADHLPEHRQRTGTRDTA